MVFQQFNLLDSKTVFHNIALPLILEKAPKDVIEEKVNEVLRFVELEDKKDTYVSQLSGGQKQRVGIARALTTTPDILLCDEATSALDVTVQKQILELLIELKKKENLSFILICHDLALVQAFCDRVLVLYHGKTVESGTLDETIDHPKMDYTRKLIDSVL